MKYNPTIHLRSLGFLFLSIMMVFLGCNNSNNDCDPTAGIPSNCNDIEPTTGDLSIDLTINTENPFVPIEVYYGYAEDNVLYFTDTLSGSSTSYSVPVNQRYSVVAKYAMQGRTVYAIDGGKVKLKTKDNCGYTCYSTVDLDLNLKLAR